MDMSNFDAQLYLSDPAYQRHVLSLIHDQVAKNTNQHLQENGKMTTEFELHLKKYNESTAKVLRQFDEIGQKLGKPSTMADLNPTKTESKWCECDVPHPAPTKAKLPASTSSSMKAVPLEAKVNAIMARLNMQDHEVTPDARSYVPADYQNLLLTQR